MLFNLAIAIKAEIIHNYLSPHKSTTTEQLSQEDTTIAQTRTFQLETFVCKFCELLMNGKVAILANKSTVTQRRQTGIPRRQKQNQILVNNLNLPGGGGGCFPTTDNCILPICAVVRIIIIFVIIRSPPEMNYQPPTTHSVWFNVAARTRPNQVNERLFLLQIILMKPFVVLANIIWFSSRIIIKILNPPPTLNNGIRIILHPRPPTMHINKCLFGDDGIGFPFKHETVSISGCWMAGWSAVCQVKVARIIIYKSFRVFLFIHLIAPPLFSSNPSYDGPEGGLFCGFSSAVNNFNEFVGLKSVESFVPFRLWVRVCVCNANSVRRFN